jgi:hypothetical protein
VHAWCEQAQQLADIPVAATFDYGWEVYAQIALTLRYYRMWQAGGTAFSNVRRELEVYAGSHDRADIILSYQWGGAQGTDIIEMKCESKTDRNVPAQFAARLHKDIEKLRDGVINAAFPNPRRLVFGITASQQVTTETRAYFQEVHRQSLGVLEEPVGHGTHISVFFWHN